MIEIREVFKKYKKGPEVLKGLSLSCTRGKIYNLLGVNGAGKTTLINIMSGLLSMDSGSVLINGHDISLPSEHYRKHVGYVFEKPLYIERLTAWEYLDFVARLYAIPREVKKQRIQELCEFFELEGESKKLIENYSKGMKGKISLAAALIHQPECLILDEPFDGIDFLMMQKIVRLFRSMVQNGATIFISSHQMETNLNMSDHFFVLVDGQIRHSITSTQVKTELETDKALNGASQAYFEKLLTMQQ